MHEVAGDLLQVLANFENRGKFLWEQGSEISTCPSIKQSSVGKKDGNWYIYPQFLVHENVNNSHKKRTEML